MRIGGLILVVATIYQLFRFTILFFSIVLAVHGTAAMDAIAIVLAIAAPSLVVILLLIRLGFAGSAALLSPLRTVGLIQIVTAAAMTRRLAQSQMPLIPEIPGAMVLLAGVILISDFAFLLFLLLYGRSMEVT